MTNFIVNHRGWHQIGLCLLVACCSLTTLAGCGDGRPEVAPVSGTITIDGQPLTEGRIIFYPTEGRSATAAIDADGTYELTTFEKGDGALPGSHKVTITAKKASSAASAPKPKSFEEELQMGAMGSAEMASPPSLVRWLVPKTYSRRESTSLTANVVRGEKNKLNFDISTR